MTGCARGAVLALLLAAFAVACAGSIDDPDAFFAADATASGGSTSSGGDPGGSTGGGAGGVDGGSGGSSGGTTGAAVPANCDAPTLVFQVSCITCHGPAPFNLGALDLISPNVATRLVNVPAALCGTETYVIPGQPGQSFLYQKVTEAQPNCGSQMPQNGLLSTSDQQCVAGWIANLPGG